MEQGVGTSQQERKTRKLSGNISLIQPLTFKYFTLLILFIVAVSGVFISISLYSKKVQVTGVIQPNTGLVRMTASQAGIVHQLLVVEGQQVVKNQPLLRIISEKYGVEGFESNQALISQYQFQLNILNQQQLTQKSQHDAELDELRLQQQNFSKRLTQLDIQQSLLAKRVLLNEEIVKQISQLAGSGYISEVELNKQRSNLLALQQQDTSLTSQKLSLESQLEQLTSQLKKLPIIQARSRDTLMTQLVDTKAKIAMVEQRKLSEVRAPVAGVVTGLLVTQGRAVKRYQAILSILPENSLMQAVLYVPTSALGFLNKGQETKLRYHAFPYQRFGMYQGKVAAVSANVILPNETEIPGLINSPSYRVIVRLDNQDIQAYGRSIPLRSGMKLDADIVIEQRSLFRWLFDPIFSMKGQL